VAVDPSGKFVYVADDAVGNIVTGFAIDPAGALTVLAGSPFSAGKLPNWATVARPASFAYVVNAGDNTVSGYTIRGATRRTIENLFRLCVLTRTFPGAYIYVNNSYVVPYVRYTTDHRGKCWNFAVTPW
jgi:DNA-binding beta-propeller fold protein YncE